MHNISDFAQSVQYFLQLLLLSSRPGKGPVVLHPSKMPSSQMNTSAERRASAHGPLTNWKRERRLHQAWHVAPKQPYILNPVDYAVCGALQQRVYHRRKFNTVEELN